MNKPLRYIVLTIMIRNQKAQWSLIAFPVAPKTLHLKCAALALLSRMAMCLTLLTVIGSRLNITVFSATVLLHSLIDICVWCEVYVKCKWNDWFDMITQLLFSHHCLVSHLVSRVFVMIIIYLLTIDAINHCCRWNCEFAATHFPNRQFLCFQPHSS